MFHAGGTFSEPASNGDVGREMPRPSLASVSSLGPLCLFITTASIAACNEPARSGAASARPAPQAAKDVTGYCASVCKRASACAIERAEALAKAGSDVDRAALLQAKADADRNESSCSTACVADAVEPAQADKLQRAEGCIHQTSCAFVERCLRDTAGLGDSPG